MPRKAVKSKNELVPLNMTVPKAVRVKLEDSARKSGRSLTGEVSDRVERSYTYETAFSAGDPQIAETVNRLLGTMLVADAETRRKLAEQVITSCNSVLPLIVRKGAEKK
jgi:hypothetical protein